MKVLLIEDDPIFQKMYQDEFSKIGFDFISSYNGKDGIKEAIQEQPDFILLDIMMPGVDGVSVFKYLKKTKETKDLPVAFLTVVPEGVPQALHHDPMMTEGAVGYWSKDKYTPIEVVEMVKKHLKVGN